MPLSLGRPCRWKRVYTLPRKGLSRNNKNVTLSLTGWPERLDMALKA